MERFAKFRNYSKIPAFEEIENLKVDHPRFFVVPGFMKWFDGISYFFATLPTIFRIRKKFDFDLIDLHWVYPDILAGFLYARLFGRKWIVTVRGKEAIIFGRWDPRTLIVNSLLRKANHIIALSGELAAILRHRGIPGDKISVIRNGVDVGRFRRLHMSAARKKIGLAEDSKIMLSVGSLIEGKGFHKVITAMPDLIQTYPDLRYYIVGSPNLAGNFEADLRELIRKLALTAHVKLVGAKPNEELIHWYNAADLFCLPSYGEGSPNVVFEALACGLPVVATAVGDVPETLQESFLGYTVEPGNQPDLKDKLALGLITQWDRAAISKHMRSFTWEHCSEQVLQVYRKVVTPLPKAA